MEIRRVQNKDVEAYLGVIILKFLVGPYGHVSAHEIAGVHMGSWRTREEVNMPILLYFTASMIKLY